MRRRGGCPCGQNFIDQASAFAGVSHQQEFTAPLSEEQVARPVPCLRGRNQRPCLLSRYLVPKLSNPGLQKWRWSLVWRWGQRAVSSGTPESKAHGRQDHSGLQVGGQRLRRDTLSKCAPIGHFHAGFSSKLEMHVLRRRNPQRCTLELAVTVARGQDPAWLYIVV